MNKQPGKIALVTGGCRRLGAIISAELARGGYQLAITSSEAGAQPDDALQEAAQEAGIGIEIFAADLSDHRAAPRVIDNVKAHFGRAPDLLVNNASLFGQDEWPAMDAATLEAHFALNFFAPTLLSAALVEAAGEAARPAIVHILDQRIRNPHRDQISYTLSKQALAASVRSMAAAFGGRARVNGVAPGLVISTDDYDNEQMARLDGMMPLGELPAPQNVAKAVAYLASADDSTGQIIYTDGGAHLKSFDRDFMHL